MFTHPQLAAQINVSSVTSRPYAAECTLVIGGFLPFTAVGVLPCPKYASDPAQKRAFEILCGRPAVCRTLSFSDASMTVANMLREVTREMLCRRPMYFGVVFVQESSGCKVSPFREVFPRVFKQACRVLEQSPRVHARSRPRQLAARDTMDDLRRLRVCSER